MITLRLFDISSTHGILELLYGNGYKYVNNLNLTLEDIKDDIIKIFEYPNPTLKFSGYSIYYIEIHHKKKTFGLHSKWADKNYMRAEKLKQLNLW